MEELKSVEELIEECERRPIKEHLDDVRKYMQNHIDDYTIDELSRISDVLKRLYQPYELSMDFVSRAWLKTRFPLTGWIK